MAKIDLQGDEFVVMENRNFTVRSIPLDAILTTRRLIFIDSRKNAIPQRNIPLTAIHNIELGENTEKDQTVTLSLITESGEIRQMVLTLSRQAGSERKWEYDEWVTKLKEHTVSATAMAQMSKRDPADQVARVKSVTEPEVESAVPPKSPDAAQSSVPGNLTCPPPAKKPKRLSFITIAAIILVIVVIIGGVIVFGQITKGKTQPTQNMVTTSVMTTVATPIPTPIPSPTILKVPTTERTPTPVTTPQYIIPSTGTWVRVQYPGNFVGNVGAGGVYTPINSTGEQFIQLPAPKGVITGSVEKQDGSNDKLIVEIYKDGALVFSKNTIKPRDIIDIHLTL